MLKLIRPTLLLFFLLASWLTAEQPEAKKEPAKKASEKKAAAGKDVFGPSKVWQFHVEIAAKEWDKMQPTGGMKFPGFGPGPKKDPAEKPGDKPADVHKGGGFGMEYPWAHADFSAEGKTFKNVGLRFKGNFTYMASANTLKRPLQIDLEHYGEETRFHGLKKLNFGNGVTDPARMRESLGFAVFRAAGVPAPRTAYAQLTLTLPGKYDKEYVGLYTLIEHVGNGFLKDHFKSAKGLLVKPEGLRSLDYLGAEWAPYDKRYRPKTDASKKHQRRLIDFTRLVNRGDDAQFNKEIASYLDINEFLRFMAVNALLVNLDSFLGVGHNYFMYLRPDTNRFVFIPWDLDLSMASFPMGGTPDQQLDLSLQPPHMGQNKLIDRLLAMKEINEKYQKVLKELAATCFTKEKLLKDIDVIEKATKEALAKEKKAVEARKEGGFGFGPKGGMGGPGGMFGKSPSLRTFVEKRTESVLAQLEGKSKGYVPVIGFGPGGPKGGFGPKGGPGMFMAKPLLMFLDTDKDGKVSKDEWMAAAKKFFNDCDKDKAGKLDDKALAEGLNKLFPPPPGFGPPKKEGPKGGFGPGQALAGSIMKRADTNKDGKVSLDEFVAAAEILFMECDKDKKGKLDEPALAAGINMLFPQPKFGPPGFGPPGEKPPPDPKKDGPGAVIKKELGNLQGTWERILADGPFVMATFKFLINKP
jgi:spore coat protein H